MTDTSREKEAFNKLIQDMKNGDVNAWAKIEELKLRNQELVIMLMKACLDSYIDKEAKDLSSDELGMVAFLLYTIGSLNKAIEFAYPAADKGNCNAQYILGVTRNTMSQHLSNALPYFQKAAKQGHALAQLKLARY